MDDSRTNDKNSNRFCKNRREMYRPICIISVVILACILAIVGIFLSAVGVTKRMESRVNNHPDNQWETTCFVFQYKSTKHPCESCNTSNCQTSICYDETIKVSYSIFDGTQILSSIILNNNQNKQNIQLGHEYTCYYDRSSDFKSVKFEYTQYKSESTIIIIIGIIILIIALFILILLGIFAIFIEGPRLKQMKRRNQMLRHLSDEHKFDI